MDVYMFLGKKTSFFSPPRQEGQLLLPFHFILCG
jgi:hypothetical protein